MTKEELKELKKLEKKYAYLLNNKDLMAIVNWKEPQLGLTKKEQLIVDRKKKLKKINENSKKN